MKRNFKFLVIAAVLFLSIIPGAFAQYIDPADISIETIYSMTYDYLAEESDTVKVTTDDECQVFIQAYELAGAPVFIVGYTEILYSLYFSVNYSTKNINIKNKEALLNNFLSDYDTDGINIWYDPDAQCYKFYIAYDVSEGFGVDDYFACLEEFAEVYTDLSLYISNNSDN